MAVFPSASPEDRREAVARALEALAHTVRTSKEYSTVEATINRENRWSEDTRRSSHEPERIGFQVEIELRKPRKGWPR